MQALISHMVLLQGEMQNTVFLYNPNETHIPILSLSELMALLRFAPMFGIASRRI